MRVYLPATFTMLSGLKETGEMYARSGYGFALTQALRDFYDHGDDEEIAHAAFQDAAEASIRLLAIGDENTFPHRRVVVSVDLPDEQVDPDPELGDSVVKLRPARISVDQLAAIHIDIEESEAATAKAIEVIDESDLGVEDAELIVGDALDNFMAFYDPTELPFLIELM
ncbi:hypothetical protein GP475_03245 [Corynebacterium poyangense]|uniref:Uncharacterized protein n=1 Tax=Corynebacterium poyangense TaxID=2684405 RepID=A0A7H0SMJ8_9CORY|nr:hypothetical protein [Corynebacterium poyangense]MBZ8176879.1 hypothetical protein [Corynebacterium poyangense]QNQ89773.1 hypothetical protein GP475_03245 [Corynebacterium poyangense]